MVKYLSYDVIMVMYILLWQIEFFLQNCQYPDICDIKDVKKRLAYNTAISILLSGNETAFHLGNSHYIVNFMWNISQHKKVLHKYCIRLVFIVLIML